MSRKGAMFYVGMGVSLGFILYAAAKLDFHKAFEVMLWIHSAWLIPYAAIFFASFYVRAIRLRYITLPLKPVPVGSFVSSVAIGFMGNMVFPLRLGELMRVYVTAKKENLSKSSVLATIVVERVFDLFSLVALLVITLMIARPAGVSPRTLGTLQGVGATVAAVTAAAAVFLYFLSRNGSAINGLINRIFGLMPALASGKGQSLMDSFRSGLQVLGHGGHLGSVLFHSCTLWAVNVAVFLLALPLFGLAPSLEIACVMTVFVSVGIALPSSPGFIGPFHAAIVFALGLYGVDVNTALGVAIFVHMFTFSGTVILGIYFAWKEKIGFAELRGVKI